MSHRNNSLPWVLALVTIGALLGVAAMLRLENIASEEQDADAPLFI